MFRCLLIFLFPFSLAGQNLNIDSLKLALKNARHDTTRCNILNAMIEAENDDAVWPKYNQELLELAESKLKTTNRKNPLYKFYQRNLATAFHNFGFIAEQQGEIQKALEYYFKCLKIDEENGDKKGIAYSLNNMGGIYHNQGNIPKALECYGKSLKIREEIGDKLEIAQTLSNIGSIYYDQGDIAKALDYHGRSLRIREELGDKLGLSNSLNNVAVIYDGQGDIVKSLEYYGRAQKIMEEIGDRRGLARLLNNVGLVYENQGDPSITSSREDAFRAGITKALEYYDRSLKMSEEMEDKQGMSHSLNNIGSAYKDHGDPMVTSSREEALRVGIDKALKYYFRSLKIREELGDKDGIANTLLNIGAVYYLLKDYSKSLEFCKRSMKVSQEVGYPQNIGDAAIVLSKIYKATGNYKLALDNYELYIQMRDSINNAATRKASIKQQLKHEYETKAAADSVAHAKETEIKNVELKKQEAEIRAKKNQQYALFGGLALVLVFAGFMYNRFKVTQKQKFIIEHQKTEVVEQKKLVEEKQKEILDSIHYAKRIQLAQIPSEKRVGSSLSRLKK